MLPCKQARMQMPRCSPAQVQINSKLRRRNQMCCNAVLGVDVVHYVQRELTIEGVLHVSTLQATSCMMQNFVDLQVLPAPGLSQPPHSVHTMDVLRAASIAGSSSSRLHNAGMARAALCLATPDDGIGEDTPALNVTRGLLSPSMSAVRTAGATGASSSTMLQCAESAAWQASYELWGGQHSTELLQAAAAVRRRRRRALVSALRAGRSAVKRLAQGCESTQWSVNLVPALARQA